MGTKICTLCKEEKPLSSFGKRTCNGKKYPNTRCHTCKTRIDRERGWRTAESVEGIRIRRNAKRREQRTAETHIVNFILTDSRSSDRKKNRPNDLDKPFIENLISQPCRYCGETDIRMVLDRVCNDGGHTKDNVVPACYRCNHIRGSMPYEAWLFLVDGMRKAREAGVFGDWWSKPTRNRNNPTISPSDH